MTTSRPLIVAGATGYGAWSANTLEGARRCLSAPVDGVEIDVQLTVDGRVVAHHDYWLEPDSTRLDGRWLDRRGPALKTLSLDTLRRYDIGRTRPGSAEALRHPDREEFDAPTPTLEELLDALNAAPGPRRLFYIEIKTDPQDPEASPAAEAITTAVLKAVAAADYDAYTKIIAFDWKVLRLTAEWAPQLATAHLTIPPALAHRVKPGPDGRSPWADGCDPRDFDGSALRAIKAHGGMEWSPHFTEVTGERVAEAEALGLKVGPWGLSKAPDIAAMAALDLFSLTVSGPDWRPEAA